MAKKPTAAAVTTTAKSVVDTSKYAYTPIKFRDKDGKMRQTRGVDDALARALSNHLNAGKTLKAVAVETKADARLDKDYKNMGQYRMALGNVLRGILRNGTPVSVGGLVIKSLTQKVVRDEVSAPPKKEKAAKKAAA